MDAYYNEIDPYCCQWLQNLMDNGLITKGVIDARPIQEVRAKDLRGFTRVHFFAGIGGWDYALNLAGWGDRPVWTGSCPCQPFSTAGKQKGHEDERHLWPEMFRLIRECRPSAVFGEQVSGAIRHGWFDLVQGDLEEEGYAFGGVVLGAHSAGSPHIRQRLYWLADSPSERSSRRPGKVERATPGQEFGHLHELVGSSGLSLGLADSDGKQIDTADKRGFHAEFTGDSEPSGVADSRLFGQEKRQIETERSVQYSETVLLENPCGIGRGRGLEGYYGQRETRFFSETETEGSEPIGPLGNPDNEGPQGRGGMSECAREQPVGPAGLAGFWSDCEWLPCRDGKSRPRQTTQSGFVLLADGFWYRMDDVLSIFAQEAVMEVMNYAEATRSSPGEILQVVSKNFRETEVSWEAGGQGDIFEAKILFDIMRDFLSAFNGPSDRTGIEKKSAQADGRILRDLRKFISDTCSSYRRKSNEQFNGKSPDALRELSQFLACCCKSLGDIKSRQNAATFPLAEKGVKGRKALLKGYGNAIVPQVAAEFIKAYMETSVSFSV